MKANPDHLKTQLSSPLEQHRCRVNGSTKLIPQLDQRSIVIGMYPQEKLSIRHKPLDRVQLVQIIKRRPDHAHIPRSTQCRRCFARIGKDDPRRIHPQILDSPQLLD